MTTQEDIKKRVLKKFDKKFDVYRPDSDHMEGQLYGEFEEKIKDFISQALDTAFKEWAKAVRMGRKGIDEIIFPSAINDLVLKICYKEGRNSTVDELNKKLQELDR